MTHAFDRALPVFDFPKSKGLRLWVLPFCLHERVLVLPTCGSLDDLFVPECLSSAAQRTTIEQTRLGHTDEARPMPVVAAAGGVR